MNPFESYTADINALITESQIQLYINSFKDKFLYIDDKIDDKIDNKIDNKIISKIDNKIHQYNDLLGSNGYIAAVYKVPYVDTDFLTMYYILKYNVVPTKRVYNAFYFGCNSNQHHLASNLFFSQAFTNIQPKYIAYGADIKNDKSNLEIKPLIRLQGFDQTGNISNINTIKSICNQINEEMLGAIWLYISDINPINDNILYNQLILAMKVEINGLIVMRLSNTCTIRNKIFILFCSYIFCNVKIFLTPWSHKFYLICSVHEPIKASIYTSYIKFLQSMETDYQLFNATMIKSIENELKEIDNIYHRCISNSEQHIDNINNIWIEHIMKI